MKPEDIPRSELIDLYKMAVDEYRFQVKLNWDRTQYMLVLNAAVLSVGVGLFKLPGQTSINPMVIPVFLLGAVTALIGASVVKDGHTYYRRAVLKKTWLEMLLGYFNPVELLSFPDRHIAITTTSTMSEAADILRGGEARIEKRPLRRGTITYRAWFAMMGLCVLNLVMVAYTAWEVVDIGGVVDFLIAPQAVPSPVATVIPTVTATPSPMPTMMSTPSLPAPATAPVP